jgi:hypothetical protein
MKRKEEKRRNWKKNILLFEVVVLAPDHLFQSTYFPVSLTASYYLLWRNIQTLLSHKR